ncbi:hypothetical protein L208DRAFT_1538357 [Tricholoma matsutake]|nr:hypothetical protein L208DRAFT_1538357 [Tricholoma matsutake 945]
MRHSSQQQAHPKCIQTESPPHKRISTPRSNSDKNSEYNSDCLSELTDLLSESDHDEPEKPTVGKGKQHWLALDQDEPKIPKAKRTPVALEEQLWLFMQQTAPSDEEYYSMIGVSQDYNKEVWGTNTVKPPYIAHALRIIMDWIWSGSNIPFPWHNIQDSSEYGMAPCTSPTLKQAVQPPPSATLVSSNIQQPLQPSPSSTTKPTPTPITQPTIWPVPSSKSMLALVVPNIPSALLAPTANHQSPPNLQPTRPTPSSAMPASVVPNIPSSPPAATGSQPPVTTTSKQPVPPQSSIKLPSGCQPEATTAPVATASSSVRDEDRRHIKTVQPMKKARIISAEEVIDTDKDKTIQEVMPVKALAMKGKVASKVAMTKAVQDEWAVEVLKTNGPDVIWGTVKEQPTPRCDKCTGKCETAGKLQACMQCYVKKAKCSYRTYRDQKYLKLNPHTNIGRDQTKASRGIRG